MPQSKLIEMSHCLIHGSAWLCVVIPCVCCVRPDLNQELAIKLAVSIGFVSANPEPDVKGSAMSSIRSLYRQYLGISRHNLRYRY